MRDIWIDFADSAFELLRTLANSLRNMDGAAADILLQAFNDQQGHAGIESIGIITYFKATIPPSHRPLPHSKLTGLAACQCLGPNACRGLPTLCAHGRRQGLLRQQHRATPERD